MKLPSRARRTDSKPPSAASHVVVFATICALSVVGDALGEPTYRISHLGGLGGVGTAPQAMNNSGQVTGVSHTSRNEWHAYVADESGITDIGTLGYTVSRGEAINSSGQVVGYSRVLELNNIYERAFFWDGSTIHNIGTFGGLTSYARDINDAGQVTGDAALSGSSPWNGIFRAFLWDRNGLRDLGTLGGAQSFGQAINAGGQVVGQAATGTGRLHPFLWDGHRMIDLGSLGGNTSLGSRMAINSIGQVAGSTFLSGDIVEHAFFWDGATMTDIGTLGGFHSYVSDMNEFGMVAGTSTLPGEVARHAYVWSNGSLIDLGTLGGTKSSAIRMNDLGHVTGDSQIAGDVAYHAFVWDGRRMYDLNSLIDPSDPLKPYVTFTVGRDINNAGQIASEGCDSRTGRCWAYLLTPITPELRLTSLSLSNVVQAGCKTISAAVRVTTPAPAGGLVVSVADTLAAAFAPPSVLIPEGALQKSFTIKTVPVAGSESGAVTVSLGASSLSQPLTVRPMGLTSITLTPTSVVGSQPATGKATLECNAGPGPITVDLSSNNAGVASPVAASIVVPQGVKTANFDVTTNAVPARSYATISGTANGITKLKRLTVNVAAAVSPTSLRFSSVTVGATSGPLNATLTNRGAVPFSITAISLTGTGASWFAHTNNCPANLAAGASCTISVRFTPQAALSKSAKLSIATSATTTPLSVSLSGTGM